MLLQVHDERVFEIAEAEVAATCDVVQEVMVRIAALDVPLVLETEVRYN